MRFPVIKVRDKVTGSEHIVGTDIHDALGICEHGQVHYHNLRNCEGTYGDYEFVGYDNGFETGVIEFVGLEELLGIAAFEDAKEEERKLITAEWIARYLAKKKADPGQQTEGSLANE